MLMLCWSIFTVSAKCCFGLAFSSKCPIFFWLNFVGKIISNLHGNWSVTSQETDEGWDVHTCNKFPIRRLYARGKVPRPIIFWCWFFFGIYCSPLSSPLCAPLFVEKWVCKILMILAFLFFEHIQSVLGIVMLNWSLNQMMTAVLWVGFELANNGGRRANGIMKCGRS